MFEYLENVLHTKLTISNYDNTSGLPLSMTGAYDFYTLKMHNTEMLVAVPKGNTNLAALRKEHKRITALTGQQSVMYLKNMTYYSRDKMIEENIPFVWDRRQIFIPYLGLALDSKARAEIPYCAKISYLTQKLLLTAIYQQWDGVNVTGAAEALGISKMSASRCYDELEAFCIRQLDVKGRSRTLSCGDKREFWDSIKPILVDPVISSYALREDLGGSYKLSGISALAGYSMLEDDPYPTYGFMKKDIGGLDTSKSALIPQGEVPGCVIDKVGYWIEFGDGKKMDPLSVALSIKDYDRKDPRVEKAIEEMLEEYVW